MGWIGLDITEWFVNKAMSVIHGKTNSIIVEPATLLGV
jgi:hypothetical protein